MEALAETFGDGAWLLILGAGQFDQAFSAGSRLTQREAVAIARNQPSTGTQTS